MTEPNCHHYLTGTLRMSQYRITPTSYNCMIICNDHLTKKNPLGLHAGKLMSSTGDVRLKRNTIRIEMRKPRDSTQYI